MKAHCRLARPQDQGALACLWQTCFGDPVAFAEDFFRQTAPMTFLADEGGAPVSMVCALPTQFIDEAGEIWPAAYLYAVCTAPGFRGRGLSTALLTFALDALRKKGVAYAALVPAEEGLFRFYEKQGFSTVFFNSTYEVPAGGRAQITPLTADGYRNLRQMQLYGDFISYGLPLLQWQKSCGALCRVETPTHICCAAAEKRGNVLHIKELLPDCPEAAAALAASMGCTAARVCTAGEDRPFGMVRSLSGAPLPAMAYLGLAFD